MFATTISSFIANFYLLTNFRVVYVGLQLTWAKSFKKIALKSNSSAVIGFINENRVIMDRNYNLTMQIKDMLGRD